MRALRKGTDVCFLYVHALKHTVFFSVSRPHMLSALPSSSLGSFRHKAEITSPSSNQGEREKDSSPTHTNTNRRVLIETNDKMKASGMNSALFWLEWKRATWYQSLFPLLFSSFLLLSSLLDLHEHQAQPCSPFLEEMSFFWLLELRRLSWNSLHFSVNPRQVWAASHSSALTHTNTRVHSSNRYTSVHKQHTHRVRHSDITSIHAQTISHTWKPTNTHECTNKAQFNKTSILLTSPNKHSCRHTHDTSLGKHAHHMFPAPGRKTKAQEEVQSMAGRGQTTALYTFFPRDCTGIFHIATSFINSRDAR